MPRYRIVHATKYAFDGPVSGVEIAARLVPRALPDQRRGGWRVDVSPRPAWSGTAVDEFGNMVCAVRVGGPLDALAVVSEGVVSRPAGGALRPVIPWQVVAHRLRSEAGAPGEGRVFAAGSPLVGVGADLIAYATESFPAGRPLLDAAADLAARIRRDFVHDGSATTASTPASEALRLRRGVCQDLAHVAIGCLRARGLAARYVGGYLAGRAEGGAHAWASVLVPDWGWVDLDPTLGGFTGPGHLTVAWGRDHGDVRPLGGTFHGEASHRIDVRVEVRPVEGDNEGAEEEGAGS